MVKTLWVALFSKWFQSWHNRLHWRLDCLNYLHNHMAKKTALELIKKYHVVRWSWWEIRVQDLDSQEWPEHVGYFGRRGGKLARPPCEKCVAVFKQESDT